MNIWLTEIWRAWRECLRRPSFLLLATGVLALGIGASAGAFALVENILLKPLPFTHAERVIALAPQGSMDVSPSQFRQMQPLQGVASMGLVSDSTQLVNVVATDSRVLAHQAWISADLLRTLDAQPQLGRGFSAREHVANGPSALLLSHGFWLRQYAGRADVLGKIVQLDGQASTVVGVLPADFSVVNDADVIRPLVLDGASQDEDQVYVALARLDGSRKPAEVAAQATVLINAARSTTTDQATKSSQLRVLANNPRRVLSHDRSGVLGLLQLCGLLVLLIALVNLVNLMVMRSGSMAHALALRDSLGASRWRLALPVVSEGLLVGLLGALFGMAAGRLGMALLQVLAPFDWLRQTELHVGAFVWLLVFAVAIAVSVIAALLGLRAARRGGGMDELREGARSGVDRRTGRLGRFLVIVQMVIATMLLMVTAMLGHAVIGESAQSPGFNAEHVLVFKIKPASGAHDLAGSTGMLAQRLVQQLRTIPGVEAATVASSLPVGLSWAMRIKQADGDVFSTQFRGVDGGYFQTLKIPRVAGRGFARADLEGDTQVAVINRHLALHRFHGNALGQFIGSGAMARRIVGVVTDTRHFGTLPRDQLYVPRSQYPEPLVRKGAWSVAVRVRGNPDNYRKVVRVAVETAVPGLPLADLQTLSQAVNQATRTARSNVWLTGVLTVLALLLAAAGQYAVMASSVQLREREFGVRMSLGASPARLMREVLHMGMGRIVLGLLVGASLGVALCLALRSLFALLGRSPIDPWALTVTCIVLVVVGAAACLLPALRAGRVQPMQALRGD